MAPVGCPLCWARSQASAKQVLPLKSPFTQATLKIKGSRLSLVKAFTLEFRENLVVDHAVCAAMAGIIDDSSSAIERGAHLSRRCRRVIDLIHQRISVSQKSISNLIHMDIIVVATVMARPLCGSNSGSLVEPNACWRRPFIIDCTCHLCLGFGCSLGGKSTDKNIRIIICPGDFGIARVGGPPEANGVATWAASPTRITQARLVVS